MFSIFENTQQKITYTISEPSSENIFLARKKTLEYRRAFSPAKEGCFDARTYLYPPPRFTISEGQTPVSHVPLDMIAHLVGTHCNQFVNQCIPTPAMLPSIVTALGRLLNQIMGVTDEVFTDL